MLSFNMKSFRNPVCLFLSLSACLSAVEVVAVYEYKAEHEDELTLRQGDIIKNVRRIEEEGWMEGDLNGRRGLFPDNFVKVNLLHRLLSVNVHSA